LASFASQKQSIHVQPLTTRGMHKTGHRLAKVPFVVNVTPENHAQRIQTAGVVLR
jgi:hypothetical protein